MFLVMVAVHRSFRGAVQRSSSAAASVRSFGEVNRGVVFGALMMVIPLAVTLAHSYGFVDDPDSGRRITMIILGGYLAVIGNAMPKNLPPMSSMPCDGARVQAFRRVAGWTWTLCGLGFAAAWLGLPIDAAAPVSTALVIAALISTSVQLLRIRKPGGTARA
jgi:hypothetical protein